tara:strand:+ start:712 stop:1020 length:309 start_codon:yes stop_codon:yes gene_type:complete
MSAKETIDISEENGILVCTIRVPPRNYAFGRTLIYRTDSVIEMLLKKGYDIDQVIESTLVHNKPTKANTYKGTWKFKLTQKSVKKVTTKPRRTKATTKKTKE